MKAQRTESKAQKKYLSNLEQRRRNELKVEGAEHKS